MQIRPPKNPGREPTQSGASGAEDVAPVQAEPADDLASLADATLLGHEQASDHEQESDPDAITSRIPNITRMPEGYEVVEQKVGRAVGQWVLMVRCQCGRRWFEVEEIEAATCPRCGLLVYVDALKRGK